MIKLKNEGYYTGDKVVTNENKEAGFLRNKEAGRKKTITYKILQAHNQSNSDADLKLKFDAVASHDLTFVGIIQTAKASGLEQFPIPYILTNCHNSLCAVGGTINADDHIFGLSAVQKYGGIFVPPHVGVIHQYVRETFAGCGKLILGSDSHTRYGALGAMGVGEGGGELVKQLLSKTYDMKYPEVIGIYLTGKPRRGVGPHDVALSLIKAVFENGFVKNCVLEFIGPGIKNLSIDFRNGIDIMTTETTCFSSIWETDNLVRNFFRIHKRESEFEKLTADEGAYYDKIVEIDLSKIVSMIALPFHPSNAYSIRELEENLDDILHITEIEGQKLLEGTGLTLQLKDKVVNGRLHASQGSISGCAGGTYENISIASSLLQGHFINPEKFSLSIYPSSLPLYQNLMENGMASSLTTYGATIKTAICGPCFGGGEIPSNDTLNVRHTTRNFIFREGAKPNEGQLSYVALMDTRSIAATAINGGRITAGSEYIQEDFTIPDYDFNEKIYENRVLKSFNKGKKSIELKQGPNITEWPKMPSLSESILLKCCASLTDPVTTTDELIPSGDTSSYRSNPIKLAEFTLSRKEPKYVYRTKKVLETENSRQKGHDPMSVNPDLVKIVDKMSNTSTEFNLNNIQIGSMIYAEKPGDGSAREQAASCQKVLGGLANVAREYATKRYWSNLINWGIVPFLLKNGDVIKENEWLYVPHVRTAIKNDENSIDAYVIGKEITKIQLEIEPMNVEEKNILLSGSLINYNQR